MRAGTVAGNIKDKVSISKKKGFLYYFKRDIALYLLLLLPLLYILVFKYGPMYGVLMAFQDYNAFKGISGSRSFWHCC